MPKTLFDEFLAEECTPYVRGLITAAIDGATRGAEPRWRHFEFNRFDVTLDLDADTALLEDDLNPTDSGKQRMPLAEFSAALRVEDPKGHPGRG